MGEYYEKHDPPYFPTVEPPSRLLSKNPHAYERQDIDILADIEDRFLTLIGIDTTQVRVNVTDGFVKLAGTVASERIGQFLEDVATNILGVRAVKNGLEAAA